MFRLDFEKYWYILLLLVDFLLLLLLISMKISCPIKYLNNTRNFFTLAATFPDITGIEEYFASSQSENEPSLI